MFCIFSEGHVRDATPNIGGKELTTVDTPSSFVVSAGDDGSAVETNPLVSKGIGAAQDVHNNVSPDANMSSDNISVGVQTFEEKVKDASRQKVRPFISLLQLQQRPE